MKDPSSKEYREKSYVNSAEHDRLRHTCVPSLFKSFALGIVLSLCGVMASLIVIEILYRVWPSHQTIWEDRPQHYFYPQDADTLQDFRHNFVKPLGTFRIAVIGDSFTFGPYLQFDDTFPKRLERWMNLNLNQPKVEVINYGVPRYSTYHEVPVVSRALAEGADLIVMQITLNDPEHKPTWPAGLIPDKFGQLPVANPVFQFWKSLAFVIQRVKNRQSQEEYKNYFFDLFEKKRPWRLFEKSWQEIAAAAKEKNIPIAAVIFPVFGMPIDDAYPFFSLDEKVAALLDTVSIPHLDITNEYRGIPVDRLQVLPGFDRHPNEIGHRLAAEAILRWLPSLHVVPESAFPKGVVDQRIGIEIKGEGK